MSEGSGNVDAKLDERLAGVPRDVPTQRDLWPGIAARLEPRTAAELEALGASPARRGPAGLRRHWPYALAAGVGVIALAALVALGVRVPDGAPLQASSGSTTAPEAQRGPLLNAAFEAPQDERYRRTRAAMEQSFRAGLAVLAPETRARIEQNLELIRKANADIRAALAADPNSTLLHQLLESTWQQEIDLYTTVSRNTDPALARNET